MQKQREPIGVLLDDRRKAARAAIVQSDGLTRLRAMDGSSGRLDPRPDEAAEDHEVLK